MSLTPAPPSSMGNPHTPPEVRINITHGTRSEETISQIRSNPTPNVLSPIGINSSIASRLVPSPTPLDSQPNSAAPYERSTCCYNPFLGILGNKPSTEIYPNANVVSRLLLVFITFALVLSIAARIPGRTFWVVVLLIGAICFFGVVLDTTLGYISHRRKGTSIYKPNLGNTVAVVLLTIPLFTVLYLRLWYPQLRNGVLVTTNDTVSQVGFPSIALFQRKDWSSQANLRSRHGGPSGSKCYLGWYNDNATACANLSPETFGNSTECNCKEFWYNNDQVIESFEWMNTSYRYIAFDSPSWLLCNTPTYMLLLQTFFDYNVTKAIKDSSTSNPTLLLAVYDPAIGMQQAFEQGYTRMNLINANGIVAVNIGLRIRQAPGHAPAYDYTLNIASSQATDIVCDTSSNSTYQYACHVSLFITIPNFERTITTIQQQMQWSDVVASAGAFFSFVQFVSWIISAQAFQE